MIDMGTQSSESSVRIGPLLQQISNADLLDLLQRLVTQERHVTAQVVELLMEVDERRLYLAEGCSSLFTYCTQILHLTEHAAYGRIEAARAAQRYPAILEGLHDGSLSLTSVCLVASHLNAENCDAVLAAVRHKSKREAEIIVAGLYPRPDLSCATIRKLPAPRPLTAMMAEDVAAISGMDNAPESGTAIHASAATPPQPVCSRPSATVTPVALDRFKLQVTIGRETYDKLHKVRDLLRHKVPDGNLEALVDLAITRLLEHCERVKVAKTDRPRARRKCTPARRTRHVPAAVKRAVWSRDAGRCAFRGKQGRCRETAFLEFHHKVPYAANGATTVENIELRCRMHNDYEAQNWFGDPDAPAAPSG